MLPMFGYAYRYRAQDYEIREQFIQAVIDSEQGNVVIGNWYANEINKSNFAKRYTTMSPLELWKKNVSLYYTGDTMHVTNYIPCIMSEFVDFIETHMPIAPNVWYLEDYYCYVIKVPVSVSLNAVKIVVMGPDSFASRIKRRFTKEPSTYTFLGDRIMDIVEEGDSQYLMVWEAYYNSVIEVQIAN